MSYMGRAVAWWLRHYATNRQVAGSIPDGIIGIFQWHNPSGRTMALGSTQPLTEMSRARAEPDGTCAETRFRLSPKRTSRFKSAGESVQSTAGSRGVRISVSNAGYTTFRVRVRVLATHSTRQFPLHFPSHASLCAIIFRTHYTRCISWGVKAASA